MFVYSLTDKPPAFDVTVNEQASGRCVKLKIGVEKPLPVRGNVDVVQPPATDRLAALVKLYHRAIVGKYSSAPVLEKTRKIFGSAAVIVICARDNAGNEGSVNCSVGSIASAHIRCRVGIVPGVGQNVDRIGYDRARFARITVHLRMGGISRIGRRVAAGIVVALDVNGISACY